MKSSGIIEGAIDWNKASKNVSPALRYAKDWALLMCVERIVGVAEMNLPLYLVVLSRDFVVGVNGRRLKRKILKLLFQEEQIEFIHQKVLPKMFCLVRDVFSCDWTSSLQERDFHPAFRCIENLKRCDKRTQSLLAQHLSNITLSTLYANYGDIDEIRQLAFPRNALIAAELKKGSSMEVTTSHLMALHTTLKTFI
jgi:hypothetical protein